MADVYDGTVARKFLQLERRSRDKGIEFTLTLASVRNMLKSKRCAYTGVPLDTDNRSIDRIDASKGYIIGNVVACDRDFNMRKSNLSTKDIRAVCALLDRRKL